jgi:hypothetical protein
MYLHFAQKGENNKIVVKHLPLTGMLYAGSTYLIRGKQYADHNSENCYLIINTYD